ncbi:YopX family protein, partial [Streptococcus suis]
IGGMPAIYLSDIRDGYAWTEDEEVIGNIYENPELVEVATND